MTTGLLISTLMIAVVWLAAWLFHRRYLRRMYSQLDSCVCTVVSKRAIKMHHAVDTKIAALDSRADGPTTLPNIAKDAPATEVNPAIKDRHDGHVLMSFAMLTLVLAAVFLVGLSISQSRHQARAEAAVPSPEAEPQPAEWLASLQEQPTLANVSFFAAWGYRGDERIVQAMRQAAASTDKNTSRAAQAALASWRR